MNDRNKGGRAKTAELISHMVAVGRSLFSSRLKIDEETAEDLAREYAHEIAIHMGGQFVYVPRDIAFTLSVRDRAIYAEFNGANHDALARKHSVSVVRIYQILSRARREEVARRQGRLFDLPEEPPATGSGLG
jgi:Mor family transcriptional regulator